MINHTFHFYGFWSEFYQDDDEIDVINKAQLMRVLFPFLNRHNEVPMNEADIVIASVFADTEKLKELKQAKGNSVQVIHYSGEERFYSRNESFIDFTIGGHQNGEFDCFCPLSLVYYKIIQDRLCAVQPKPSAERKFAVMVGRDLPERRQLYDCFSSYKTVDGFGHMFARPAVGRYWHQDYINFLAEYKFVICPESGVRRGYHTEKIINPLLAGCVPIYLGADTISTFINEQRIVQIDSMETLDETVELVMQIDQNNEAYESILNQPNWVLPWHEVDNRFGCQHTVERLTAFLQCD